MAEATSFLPRVVSSEQEPKDPRFLPPASYLTALALAVVVSHYLPTLRAGWKERDLVYNRNGLGYFTVLASRPSA